MNSCASSAPPPPISSRAPAAKLTFGASMSMRFSGAALRTSAAPCSVQLLPPPVVLPYSSVCPAPETEVSLPATKLSSVAARSSMRPCGARSTPACTMRSACSVSTPPADWGAVTVLPDVPALLSMRSVLASTSKRLSVLGSTCAALSVSAAALRRLPDSGSLPTTTPVKRRSPPLARSMVSKPSQRLRPSRSTVPALASRRAVPELPPLPPPPTPATCWAAKLALGPRLRLAALSVVRLSASPRKTGASSTSRPARSRVVLPLRRNVSEDRSNRLLAPEACTIAASAVAWPRRACTAGASPYWKLCVAKVGASTSSRGGAPRGTPSPVSVMSSSPPAADGPAARAWKRPSSQPPPSRMPPPDSSSVRSSMPSRPALEYSVCVPAVNKGCGAAPPARRACAPSATTLEPSFHSSNGARSVTRPASSSVPRGTSLPGVVSKVPETSMRLPPPSHNTP